MAKILPFRGVLYSKTKIKNLKAVTAPPYDVISPGMREELYKSHIYNIVRIILGKEHRNDNARNNKYTRARDLLKKWLKEGVLEKDRKPALYIYEQKYFYKGKLKVRIGFISLMRIERPSSSLILPHEYTFSGPKEDRLNLIRSTEANTSPIFCIFKDDCNRVMKAIKKYARGRQPAIDVHIEGVNHRLWRMRDSAYIERIKRELSKKQVLIADGHHRYEVALNFRDEMRKRLGRRGAKRFDFCMLYLTSVTNEGLQVFPTYRVIKKIGKMKWACLEKKLEPYFYVKEVKNKSDMFRKLKASTQKHTFGIYFRNGCFYLLKLRNESILDDVIKVDKSQEWKRLNVTVLHLLIFGRILHIDRIASRKTNVVYTRDEDYAISLVKNRQCDIAFFQLPTKIKEVQDIAVCGGRMPHKSTYFYPKLLTGLVLNKL